MKKDRTRIILDKIELSDLNKFIKEHEHATTFILETSDTSGIGTNTYVTCDKCMIEKDITNYENW